MVCIRQKQWMEFSAHKGTSAYSRSKRNGIIKRKIIILRNVDTQYYDLGAYNMTWGHDLPIRRIPSPS